MGILFSSFSLLELLLEHLSFHCVCIKVRKREKKKCCPKLWLPFPCSLPHSVTTATVIKLPFRAPTRASGTIHCLETAARRYGRREKKKETKFPGSQRTQFSRLTRPVNSQADSVFSGISTFGRLPYFPCLASDQEAFDIAFLGKSAQSGS